MNTFYLRVISSNKIFFDGRAEKIVLPLEDGEKAVLAHHENMVIAIEVGEAKMQMEDGTWETLAVGTGFLEVVNNRVTMLVQTAEKPEEIDARRAEERREVMEEKLRQKQSIQEYYHTKASLARAMNRLKVSREKNTRI